MRAMREFSDEQLVDFVLGLRADDELADAVRAEPKLRRRCGALESELRGLEAELVELLETDPHDVLAGPSWRILLALDGSAGRRRATSAALALARRGDGVVEVLHVCESWLGDRLGRFAGRTPSQAAALIAPIVGELREHGVTCRGQLRCAGFGLVAGGILAEAEEISADVIVIGSSSASGWATPWRRRSVGAVVVRRARCPVLVA